MSKFVKENIESVQMKFSVRLRLDETSIVVAFLGNLPNFEKGLKDWVFLCFLGELEFPPFLDFGSLPRLLRFSSWCCPRSRGA